MPRHLKLRFTLAGCLLLQLPQPTAQALGGLPPPQVRPGGVTLRPTAKAPPLKTSAKVAAKAPAKAPPKVAGKAPAKAAAKGPTKAAAAAPSSATLQARPSADPSDPREQRIARLREQLTDLLRSPPLSRLRVGLVVQEVASGEVLAAHDQDGAFNPASNTKILTTAAALKLLGADWSYRTVLLAPTPRPAATADLSQGAYAEPAPGVLRGDLFLQGSGDPSLGLRGLAAIARSLAHDGVTRIEGDLLVDGQFRALRAGRPGGEGPRVALLPVAQSAPLVDPSAPGELLAGPALGSGALLVNRNHYAVHISPGTIGHPASAWVEPRGPFFTVDSHVQTVKGKRARLQVSHFQKDGHLVVTVRGRIGAARGEATVKQHFGESAVLAASALRQALLDFGIEVKGQVRVAAPPAGPLRVLAEHRSPLTEVCGLSNKDSNNFVADTIFKTLGGERFGLPGTLEKGSRAVAEWLGAMGVDPGRVRLVNGSGLTHENRLRPSDLNHLLRQLYNDLQLAPEFLQSLAIGGIDGTIRYRFHGNSVGLVRAKTGTLNGVSALSGYVGEHRNVLAFSILMEGFGNKRLDPVRHAQVQIVEALLRYLRADGALPAGLPPRQAPTLPPAQEGDAGEDSEGESRLAPARAPSTIMASNLRPSISPAKSAR